MNENTKLIRLNTGEDIIANCIDDNANNTILVGNPMRVVVRRLNETSKSMLIMMPWLPLEIVEDDLATISYQDIITVINPKASFVEYYNSTVEQYKALVEAEGAEDIFSEQFEDDEEGEIDVEESMEELLEMMREKKKSLLH